MKRTDKNLIQLLILLFLFYLLPQSIMAQQKDVVVIVFKNQSVRELSKKYFGNPNYWEAILAYNEIENVSDIKEGEKIKIPVGIVKETVKNISEAKKIIAEANKNGAQVLIPDLIKKTTTKFNKAISLQKGNNWSEAYNSSKEAVALANESLKKAKKMRENSADASISYVKGDVEKRKPRERLWSEASKFSKLYEADRARTLSNSLAEITFIDLSRIRLNENSQALILHSRVDVLKNKTETKVKLIKGDAFAYLLKSPKKKFDFDIPGVDAEIRSKSFWVEKESKATKLANYDGEIELAVEDSVVVVKKNQGSIIPDGGLPSKPKELLPPPKLLSPLNKSKEFNKTIQFEWSKVDGAERYLFEIAKDASFKKVKFSDKQNRKEKREINNLGKGIYYWRVASIDDLGFPGSFSSSYSFFIVQDSTKPFLTLKNLKNNFSTKNKKIILVGESEPQIKLTVNGNKITVDSTGVYSSVYVLKSGKNKIRIIAEDQSGNISEIDRVVYFEENKDVENRILNSNFSSNDNTFVTNSKTFEVRGITRRNANVSYSYDGKTGSVTADSLGNFTFKISLINNNSDLFLKIKSSAGFTKSFRYKIWLDDVPPKIKVDKFPKITKEEFVNVKGEFEDGDSLFINSEIVKISMNKFSQKVRLSEGENRISILGKDIAGNIEQKVIVITRDSTPPELLKTEIINAKDNSTKISIYAKDKYGLKKSAKVKYSIGDNEYSMIVPFDSRKNLYTEIISRKAEEGNVKLNSVELEDYQGNKFIYKIK